MAITGSYTWRGALIQNAYVRVDTIKGGKREGQVTPDMPSVSIWMATVGIYADSTQDIPLITMAIHAPLDVEESPYVALYAALKAMPGFDDMTDC